MSVIRRAQRTLQGGLLVCALACGLGALPACAVFGARNQSTVAQGRYYDPGDPRYAEFFGGLYVLQVTMEQAPTLTQIERLNLAHELGLTPQATTDAVGQRLHEEALKLSRAGLRMRLDQNPASTRPDAASAAVRTSERPKEHAEAALLSQVEASATGLLRSIAHMKDADAALDSLELTGGGLDATVDKDFANLSGAKLSEVKKNLEDAHALIALMKTRAARVRSESEQLLSAVAHAVDTDDGSLGSAAADAAAEAAKAAQAAETAKKAGLKPRARGKPGGGGGVSPTATSQPKASDSGEAAAPKPTKPTKPPAAARDFEP
ncbi:MAG: hypothetical protein ABJB12_20840 [Pseudomonadota bacterium]